MSLETNRKSELAQFSTDNPAAWGEQIRSYTLQPFQLIKDTRTGVETKSDKLDLNSIWHCE